MVLKLYGLTMATCTKRVRCVLEELDVPYELVDVNIFNGEHKHSSFKAKQPFGQIPYIEEDGEGEGFVLYESRAICRYLALKYGGVGTLIPDPRDLRKTALFEQAASVEMSNFDHGASGMARERRFKEIMKIEDQIDPVLVEHYRKSLESRLEGYDALLAKQKYVAGDEYSLVDIFHLSYGSMLKDMDFDYLQSEKYPNIARWWKDISNRPAWKKVNAPA